MKLRQKLAMVLATAMVVTTVPVVTFAASTNRVTNVAKVTEDAELTAGIAPQLVVELKDGITSGASFYVNLENAEWLKDTDGNYLIDGVTVDGYKLEAESKTELKVTATADNGNDKIYIPMLTQVKSGEAKAIIEETKAVTGGEYVFATTQAGSVSVKVEDTTSFYAEGGKIGTIILTEDTIGAFAETAEDGKVEITVALDSSDFTFSGKPEVTLDRGFGTKTINESNIVIDKDEMTITMDKADLQGTEKGRITIKGAAVSTKEKAPEVGELKVQILNDAVSKEAVKVAEIADYGVSLTVKDDKVVEFVAGNTKEVEFTLKEKVKSTMANSRKVEFTLEQGYFDVTTKTPLTITFKQDSKKLETIKIDDKEDSRLVLDKDDNVIGVEVTTQATDSTADSIIVNGTVVAEMDQAGDITVKAEGRAIGAEVETVVAKANAAVKVEATGFDVEAGVKGQKGGKLVITETDKGMLKKGGNLEFYLPLEDGLTFTGAPTVEVTAGDIKLDTEDLEVEKVEKDNKVVGYKVSVPVTRASREASTIEVKDFEVKLDRSVPTGKYDLEVKGSAIGTVGSLEQKGFFAVGISGEQVKVTTTITKDATEMVVNGEKVTLPAAAYIKNGKLMAPLRVIANAFGFENSAINYNSATKEILIFGNGSIIKLTVGSKQAYVNGTTITLAVPAEIKAESTYVPVGDLGRLLGLDVKWDNNTKTATFAN